MGYTYRGDLPQTGVRFRTEDAALQELFELAQQKAKKNIFDFGGKTQDCKLSLYNIVSQFRSCEIAEW